MKFSSKEWKIKRFEKAKAKRKKYTAILENKETGKTRRMNFGAIKKDGRPYEQYEDTTGLGLYSKYDHKDKERRRRYRLRHAVFLKKGFITPASLSYVFLW
jgi:hypothetical protein